MTKRTQSAIGSLWTSNDVRDAKGSTLRTIRVIAIEGDHAKVENVAAPGRYTKVALKSFGVKAQRGFSAKESA